MEIEDLLRVEDNEELKNLIRDYINTLSEMKARATTLEDILRIGKYTLEDHLSLYELKNGELRRIKNEVE